MTKEEIERMYKEIMKTKFSVIEYSKNPLWLRAFAEYNEGNKERLSVTCSQCYVKVYRYCIDRLKS